MIILLTSFFWLVVIALIMTSNNKRQDHIQRELFAKRCEFHQISCILDLYSIYVKEDESFYSESKLVQSEIDYIREKSKKVKSGERNDFQIYTKNDRYEVEKIGNGYQPPLNPYPRKRPTRR